MFLDADYSAIEARIVTWLAGQEDALSNFRLYDSAKTKEEKLERDVYRIQASDIFRIPVSSINDFPQRFVGKSAVLGCGFGMGPKRFRDNCLDVGKYDLPEGLEHKAVKSWRARHKKVVKLWADLEQAAMDAVLRKDTIFPAGAHLSFKCVDLQGMPFLLMKLPSGRKLAYPRPKIVPGKFEGTQAVAFYANLKGTKWGHMSVWGGFWAENATQGVDADVMANGVHLAEGKGYETATLIHDQDLSYYHPERGQTVEEFVRLLTTLPTWGDGLPLKAEGHVVPFYKKS